MTLTSQPMRAHNIVPKWSKLSLVVEPASKCRVKTLHPDVHPNQIAESGR